MVLCLRIAEGKIKWKENIFEGLESAPKGLAYLKEKALVEHW